jgi:hydrogenase maturation protein HypF
MSSAALSSRPRAPRQRERLYVQGIVQGVGFRPFVYREALALGLAGWVANTPAGVTIEVEGSPEAIAFLIEKIEREPPPNARVTGLVRRELARFGAANFEIRESVLAGAQYAMILPDLAPCEECRTEIFNPSDRRFRHPFTNCTNCGPRYSIIADLPYDRARTSMRAFPMCAECRAEYNDPGNRRFHAEPNACPNCGPQLAVWNGQGELLAQRDAALTAAAEALRRGEIVAVKGVGGFHLMVDARNVAAVERLRARKHREEKPFAVMFPSLSGLAQTCVVSHDEATLLTSPQRPIVLLRRRRPDLAANVAPRTPCVGAMLPGSPLHELLLSELGFPIVATSGNLSDEPIVIDEREALMRLGGIADQFLVHDRPILRPLDDSITRVVAGRPQILRRARGYAPLPIVTGDIRRGILALGGHLKTTIALSTGSGIAVSQHLGDLETAKAREAYDRAAEDITHLYRTQPRIVARDLHPDYHSSRIAQTKGMPTVAVQHHLAHVAACMAEHDLAAPALGVAFDGAGYGVDGTVWGGEFLLVTDAGWRRVAHLRPFRLPGGEAAIRQPRRAAFGLLYEAFGRDALTMTDLPPIVAFTSVDRNILAAMVDRGLNAPVTSSVGRLFDAVASLTGLRQSASYEGQAAAELESAIDDDARAASGARERPPHADCVGLAYAFALRAGARFGDPILVDWEPALHAILADIRGSAPIALISSRFHLGLAAAITEIAVRQGEPEVVLTGGCFQNARLTEMTIESLRAADFMPHWHERIPPNDGGVALGQAVWAAHIIEKGEAPCA